MDIVIIDTTDETEGIISSSWPEGNVTVNTFNDLQSALLYVSKNQTDIIFVDTYLCESRLTLLARQIPTAIPTIITSTSGQHAAEAFDLGALDYLVKPFTPSRCRKALAKFRPKDLPKSEVFFVKVNNQLIKLRFEDVHFIEADGDYVAVNTTKSKYLVNIGIKAIEDVLRDKPFVRIHRSYIVAIDKIDRIADNKVFIKSLKLPIGNAYKKELMAALYVV